MQAGRSIYTLNPQTAECALAVPAIPISVLKRLFDTFERNAIGGMAPAAIAFGQFQYFSVAGVFGNAPLDPSHEQSPQA
jgi:hypothetical protein